MAERFCDVGEVTLCYETFGDRADPTVLLVMGLGTQMIAWRTEFCEELAGHGYHVVRFDNRDVGRSTKIDAAPPTVGQLLRRSPSAGAYRLADMAADTIGLLDCLEVDSAHVVGASMGGMIAQLMAARHPRRVRSLASIMSNTGSRYRGQPHLRLYPLFLKRAPTDRDAFIAHVTRIFAAIGSPGFDHDEDEIRTTAEESFDRGHDPSGGARQLGAIAASGDRTSDLRTITAPTVVIHGTRDRLVGPSGGRATARAIPGARLVMIEGMGHDLPRGAWAPIIEAVVSNARRADDARKDAGARAA